MYVFMYISIDIVCFVYVIRATALKHNDLNNYFCYSCCCFVVVVAVAIVISIAIFIFKKSNKITTTITKIENE